MAVVYRHIGLDNNEVFYIGIGKDLRRPYRTDGRNNFWDKYVKKHGYIVEVLTDNVDYELAKEIEIALIEKYGRRNLGKGALVNLTDGGDGSIGWSPTIETRKRQSEAQSGQKSHLYGTKRPNHSKIMSGKNNPIFGTTRSDEIKDKISITKKNAPKKQCCHCGKFVDLGNMGRWHGDNCKKIKQ